MWSACQDIFGSRIKHLTTHTQYVTQRHQTERCSLQIYCISIEEVLTIFKASSIGVLALKTIYSCLFVPVVVFVIYWFYI
jgi:low temperature requirement protein LtrA